MSHYQLHARIGSDYNKNVEVVILEVIENLKPIFYLEVRLTWIGDPTISHLRQNKTGEKIP